MNYIYVVIVLLSLAGIASAAPINEQVGSHSVHFDCPAGVTIGNVTTSQHETMAGDKYTASTLFLNQTEPYARDSGIIAAKISIYTYGGPIRPVTVDEMKESLSRASSGPSIVVNRTIDGHPGLVGTVNIFVVVALAPLYEASYSSGNTSVDVVALNLDNLNQILDSIHVVEA